MVEKEAKLEYPLGTRIPSALFERMKNAAKKFGRTEKFIVCRALEKELDRMEKEEKQYSSI